MTSENSQEQVQEQSLISPASLGRIAARIGLGLGFKERILMTYRPRICPYHRLIEHVPHGCTVLDIGCGNGLWLFLLAELGRIRGGVGFDVSAEKVRIADKLKRSDMRLNFRYIATNGTWPDESVDCVTIIDVIHHVPPDRHRQFVQAATGTSASRIVIKDIDPASQLKSAANTFHDILLSGQRPHYCRPDDLCRWLNESGFAIRVSERCDMLWYSHFLIVADRK